MSGTRTYDIQTWTTGSKESPAGPINGPRLSHMDQGISDAFDLANSKLEFQSTWDVEIDHYNTNDVVIWNGRLWYAAADVTDNSVPGSESPWVMLTPNTAILPVPTIFDIENNYNAGDLIINASDGFLYQANKDVTTGSTPHFDPTDWNLLGMAVIPQSLGEDATAYEWFMGKPGVGLITAIWRDDTNEVRFIIGGRHDQGAPIFAAGNELNVGLAVNDDGSIVLLGNTTVGVLKSDSSGNVTVGPVTASPTLESFETYRSRGTYASGTAYHVGDYVKGSDSNAYVCIQAGTGHNPTTSAPYWTEVPQDAPVFLRAAYSEQADPGTAQTPAAAGSVMLYAASGSFGIYKKDDGRDFAWSPMNVAGTHLQVSNGIVLAEDNDGTLTTIALSGSQSQFLDGTGTWDNKPLKYQGEYDGDATYEVNDVASYASATFAAKAESTNIDPLSAFQLLGGSHLDNTDSSASAGTSGAWKFTITGGQQLTGLRVLLNSSADEEWLAGIADISGATLATVAVVGSILSDGQYHDVALSQPVDLSDGQTFYIFDTQGIIATVAGFEAPTGSIATVDNQFYVGDGWQTHSIATQYPSVGILDGTPTTFVMLGATALDGLTDVVTEDPASGDILVYDDENGVFHNAQPSPVREIIATNSANYDMGDVGIDTVFLYSDTGTLTVPAIESAGVCKITVKNVGTGIITVSGRSGETIDGVATKVLDTQFQSVDLVPNGTDGWSIV